MPNRANRNTGGGSNHNVGQPKHETGKTPKEKPNTERSDVKHNTSENNDGNTSRTSNQGRKAASGGSADD